MTNKFFIFSLFVFFVVASSPFRGQIKTDSVEYRIIMRQDSAGNCEDSLNLDRCAAVTITFPYIFYQPDTSVQHNINREILRFFIRPVFSELYATFDLLIADFLRKHELFCKGIYPLDGVTQIDKDIPEQFYNWILYREGKVRYNRKNILSLEVYDYEQIVGYLPGILVIYMNFDIRTGDEIFLENIFSENNLIELNKIAEKEFRKVAGLSKWDNLAEAGFLFPDNQFRLHNNFLITDSGFYFRYNNDDEIMEFPEGSFSFSIPFELVEKLIDRESSVLKLIRK